MEQLAQMSYVFALVLSAAGSALDTLIGNNVNVIIRHTLHSSIKNNFLSIFIPPCSLGYLYWIFSCNLDAFLRQCLKIGNHYTIGR